MSAKSKIEWTEATWNPTSGCTKISPACINCYAETMANRFWKDRPFTEVHIHPERLEIPLHWSKPRLVFVDSMSDLFHPDIPFDFIDRVFQTMAKAWWHMYQILTKRPAEALEYLETFACKMNYIERLGAPWPFKNIWLGVSCEDQSSTTRIEELLSIPAAIHFVNLEPLLSSIDLVRWLPITYAGDSGYQRVKAEAAYGEIRPKINWVIVGGESGPHARPMHPDWVRSIRDQCQAAGVPFFFKQWGAYKPLADLYEDWEDLITQYSEDRRFILLAPNSGQWQDTDYQPPLGTWGMLKTTKSTADRLLDGREWNEYPDVKS